MWGVLLPLPLSMALLVLPGLQQRNANKRCQYGRGHGNERGHGRGHGHIVELNALPSSLSSSSSSSILTPSLLMEDLMEDPMRIAQHPAISALSIDLRPRSRLKPRHKYLFDTGSTNQSTASSSNNKNNSNSNKNDTLTVHQFELFNKLARACCDTGVVCRKELFETYAAACHIHARFPHMKRIADLASGHGLLSWFLLALDHYCYDNVHVHDNENENEKIESPTKAATRKPRTVICVDRRMPPSADAIATAMIQSFPQLEERWSYVQADLSAIEPHPSCLLTSVHACGTLTDYLIEIAIGTTSSNNDDNNNDGDDNNDYDYDTGSSPLAVVPCCHTVKARKGYRPHFLSGMDATEVAELVEEKKKVIQENNMKHEAVADVVDEVRCQTLRNAGYAIEEVMLPKSFTGRNRLLMGEQLTKLTEVGGDTPVSTSKSNTGPVPVRMSSKTFFERPTPNQSQRHQHPQPLIRIPLADDKESIRQCQAISGRENATRRFIQQIPNHFSPSLVMSIWITTTTTTSNSGMEESKSEHLRNDDSSSSSEHNSVLILKTLKDIANQCCRDIDDERYRMILCEVNKFGDVNIQTQSGRQSQRYKFTYSMPEGTDISLANVSRDTAKIIDGKIRKRIIEKFGNILR